MKKMISVIIGCFLYIAGIIGMYFLGKRKGFEDYLNKQLKQDNNDLAKEIKDIEKIKNIENTTKLASDDDAINGLREWVAKDDHA